MRIIRLQFLCMLLVAAVGQPLQAEITILEPPAGELTGWLDVLWANPRPGEPGRDPVFTLTLDDGETVHLSIDEPVLRAAGGLMHLNRTRITIAGSWDPRRQKRARQGAETLQVRSMRAGSQPPSMMANPVTPAGPWISILCKFADVLAEPKPLAYFQDMYASTYPGLDHYWREASNGLYDVTGSTAYGWSVLPQPRSYYVYDRDGDGTLDLDFERSADDCIATADPAVDFTQYRGVNLVFNDDLDGSAWGGGTFQTLDGQQRRWAITWLPPWAYLIISGVEHEMGHGLGLPHSSGMYGETYDNRWDVVSDMWTDCSRSTHATYGCLGQHTIGYHRDSLEWIDAPDRYVHAGGTATITLERAVLRSGGSYVLAKIPIGTNWFYTVELRQRVGYDIKLPGEGLIIHEVDTLRTRPAQVIDVDLNGNTGDEGAIWRTGETFTDAANKVTIEVVSYTATTATIQITGRTGTQTQLSQSADNSLVGQSVTFTATVTPGATGSVTFRTGDTVLGTSPLSGGTATLSTTSLPAGLNHISATYSGDDLYNGSTAYVYHSTANPSAVVVVSSANPAAHGTPLTFTITVSPAAAAGYVYLYSGAQFLGWSDLDDAGKALISPGSTLAVGTHSILAEHYADSYRGTSPILAQQIDPPSGTPTNVTARAETSTRVRVDWTPVDGASYYYVLRWDGSTSADASVTPAFWIDESVSPGKSYWYQVYAWNGEWSAPSARDIATTIFFTDDPVIAQSTGIKMVHFQELRTAVNAVRLVAPLPTVTFDDSPLAAGQIVRAQHLRQLRTALGEARAALYVPPIVDPGVVAGETLIRGIDVQELRDGVK